MFKEWTLQRAPTEPDHDIFGAFTLDDGVTYISLERDPVAIAPGRYELDLTKSTRAEAGTLWSPYPEHPHDVNDPSGPWDHCLPLIKDVPGRSGLRVHAFNLARQSEGCVGTAERADADHLIRSQPTVKAIVDRLIDAKQKGARVFLTILPAEAA